MFNFCMNAALQEGAIDSQDNVILRNGFPICLESTDAFKNLFCQLGFFLFLEFIFKISVNKSIAIRKTSLARPD